MRHSSANGRTLIEAMLTMALLSFILLIVAVTVKRYGNLNRYAEKKAHSFVVLSALTDVARELSQSVSLTSPRPSSTSPSSRLEFYRLSPIAESRLPEALPAPSARPSVWQPHNPPDLLFVRYSSVNNNLVRSIRYHRGRLSDHVMAKSVVGFRALFLSTRGIRIEADIKEETKLKTLVIKSLLLGQGP